MIAILGAMFFFVCFLFGMDFVFERIPPGDYDSAKYEKFVRWRYTDPTNGELLIELGHPTVKKTPIAWCAWWVGWESKQMTEQEIYDYHVARPSFLKYPFPLIDPPITLDDGSIIDSLDDLKKEVIP